MAEAADGPRLIALEVRNYKNLRHVVVPWSDGVALFGINGAGKTNLLECLTLLLGSTRSLTLAAPRLGAPEPDDLALIVAPGPDALPWPPDALLPWLTEANQAQKLPGIQRAATDAAWWRQIGCLRGASFMEGLDASGLPGAVLDLLAELSTDPVIRYQLTVLDQSHGELRRTFTQTLLAPHIPRQVLRAVGALPAPFAPLREHHAGQRAAEGEWIPVLALPPVHRAPAVAQWLPRALSSEEIGDDLQDARCHRTITAGAYGTARRGAAVHHPSGRC